MQTLHRVLPFLATVAVLAGIAALGTHHYDGNVSALLHMDTEFGERFAVPGGIVLYQDGGYDGMLYYQVARDIPLFLSGGESAFDSPYRFQRILFPLFGFILSLGRDEWLPFAFVIINILAVTGSFFLIARIVKKINVHTLTIVFNPASLVGILYALTEPVSLFFLALFLWLWHRAGMRITVLGILALTLSLFARETTIFLIGLLGLWSLWKHRWKDASLLIIPVVLLILWQYALVQRFGSVGFQAGGNFLDLPFLGPVTVLKWALEQEGIRQLYRFSSLALLAMLLPLFVLLGREWRVRGTSVDALTFLITGLSLVLVCMDTHMWGVITSIGRVVTPFYPVYALYAAERDSSPLRILSGFLITISIVAALGIALQAHPYVLS